MRKEHRKIEILPFPDDVDIRSYDGDYGPNGDHPVNVSLFPNAFSNGGSGSDMSWGHFLGYIAVPDEREKKDGPGIIFAKLIGGRKDENVEEISVLVGEVDGTLPLAEAERLLDASGYEAFIYTTHNHEREQQEISAGTYFSWHDKKYPFQKVTDETVAEFCAQNKRYCHLRNVRLADGGETHRIKKRGQWDIVFTIRHDPEDKFRFGFPLKRPVRFGPGQATKSEWTHNYIRHTARIFGEGIVSEESKNPARFHYLPSHKPGREYHVIRFAGKLLDILEDWQIPEEPKQRAREGPFRNSVSSAQSASLGQLRHVLASIPADVSYADWFKALAAIFHETEGSEEGLMLAQDWSSGDPRYDPGEVEDIWNGLSPEHKRPATMGSLVKLAREFDPSFAAQSPSYQDIRHALLQKWL